MKRRPHTYLLVPLVLTVAWAAFYIPWERRHRTNEKLRVEQLPPAILIWPESRPQELSPEMAELKRKNQELQKQLIANILEEIRARREKANPDETVYLPTDVGPRSSHLLETKNLTGPTPAAVSLPAAEERRQP